MLIDLDRRLMGRLRLEHFAHAVVLGATLLLRLWWLDERPLHHDESIHAFHAWRIATAGAATYGYDPVYHGPALYYGVAAVLAVFGASDFTARLLPVACGTALVALAWPLRALIGRREALAFAVLVALSPTLGYYSRSLRHDVPFAACTLGALVALARYLQGGRKQHAYLAGVLAGLAFATKEDVYLLVPVLGGSLVAAVLFARVPLSTLRAALRLPLATAIVLGATVALILYTSFLTHPENWNPIDRAVRYWWGQHTARRVGGPWWYYVPFELGYEALVFLPALATAAAWIARRRLDPLRVFLVAWMALTFAIYAWAQEKAPWLLVPVLVPQALVAAHYFASVSRLRLVAWAPVAALGAWSLVSSNYLHDAMRTAEPRADAHYEPLAYVQTTYDVRRMLARIEGVSTVLGTREKTSMVVTGEAGWPLGWDLRDYPVWWGQLPPKTNAPIVIVDKAEAARVGRDLGPGYVGESFALRGWWQIDWMRFDARNLARFLLLRRAWNPLGTTDVTLFTPADPRPGLELPSVSLTPLHPRRAYRGAPETVAPARVLDGGGVLREPRGLAIADDGTIVVADTKNHRIVRLDEAGAVVASWGGPEASAARGRFREPCGVALGPGGTIYVADTWNHRVQALDREGRFMREWREPAMWGPRAVAVASDGTLFVADTGNKRVLIYGASGGAPRIVGKEGGADGQFVEPVGLALDPVSRRLFVADTGNRRVQVFDFDGRFEAQWPVLGWGEFHTEPYLARAGALTWATDSSENRVNAYDATGKLVRSLGGPVAGLARPIGIAVSAAGDVVVADTMHNRLVVFEPGPPP